VEFGHGPATARDDEAFLGRDAVAAAGGAIAAVRAGVPLASSYEIVSPRMNVGRFRATTVIPTEFKAKLPKHLSYPIGAQALSEALADSPNAHSISLFFGTSQWPASGPRRALAGKLSHRILDAEFWPANYRGTKENWFVNVWAVPCELRYSANRLLREQGLSHLIKWLRASRRPDWRSRHQTLALTFLPADASISADERSGTGISARTCRKPNRT
jgi:hypothetical protein